MSDDVQRDFKRMHLAQIDVLALLSLYLVAMLGGLVFTLRAITVTASAGVTPTLGIMCCVAMSLVGTSVFYTRKLYKALINSSYSFQAKSGDILGENALRRVGTIAFFLFRPIFGIAFSVVVYSLWRLSLSASGSSNVKLTDGFLYTTISLGFLSGFLAGRLLTMLEGYGTRRLNGLMGADA